MPAAAAAAAVAAGAPRSASEPLGWPQSTTRPERVSATQKAPPAATLTAPPLSRSTWAVQTEQEGGAVSSRGNSSRVQKTGLRACAARRRPARPQQKAPSLIGEPPGQRSAARMAA
jgi:hypothetical protein